MAVRIAGSMFWVFFPVVLFPVAVHLSNACMTSKLINNCGIEGSSVEFPCSYPKHLRDIEALGWFQKYPNLKPKPLKLPSYSFQLNYIGNGTNDCTMKLTDLRESDSSTYYFRYDFTNASGARLTCKHPNVRLRIFASPVRIQAEEVIRGYKVPVKNETMAEGQKIMLTCVPTCTKILNTNPAYIWYKDRLQLNCTRANVLSLDPVSVEDEGIYVCAVIGYNDLPSSPFNLSVRRGPRNTLGSGGGSNSVPPLTHGRDTPCSVHEIFNNCQTRHSMSVMLVPCFCMGLLIAIIVVIQLFITKKMNEKKIKKRTCTASVHGPPDCNGDSYIELDMGTLSPEYDTLDPVRHCLAGENVYDNIPQHQPARR